MYCTILQSIHRISFVLCYTGHSRKAVLCTKEIILIEDSDINK